MALLYSLFVANFLEGGDEMSHCEWKPIEEAPKTRTAILVWCPERKNTYMVTWDDRYDGEWRTFGGFTTLGEYPSHWMPVPPPPEE